MRAIGGALRRKLFLVAYMAIAPRPGLRIARKCGALFSL